MTILETIILSIVEGITEFLPISSTAHLDITRLLLGLPESEFIKSFIITIQLGAILSIVFLYRKKIFSDYRYAKNVLIAFIPTGVIGFILYKIVKSVLLGNTVLAAGMLVIGGALILILEKKKQETAEPALSIENIPTAKLLWIGVAQALAVVPGVSRSLAVILSGRALHIPKVTITEFSFLLAIPTMLAATLYDLYKSGFAFAGSEWGTLGLGFVLSFAIALFVVRWLVAYISRHTFALFGWYRIVFGVIVLIFLLF